MPTHHRFVCNTQPGTQTWTVIITQSSSSQSCLSSFKTNNLEFKYKWDQSLTPLISSWLILFTITGSVQKAQCEHSVNMCQCSAVQHLGYSCATAGAPPYIRLAEQRCSPPSICVRKRSVALTAFPLCGAQFQLNLKKWWIINPLYLFLGTHFTFLQNVCSHVSWIYKKYRRGALKLDLNRG